MLGLKFAFIVVLYFEFLIKGGAQLLTLKVKMHIQRQYTPLIYVHVYAYIHTHAYRRSFNIFNIAVFLCV